jgi:hypothetical protein
MDDREAGARYCARCGREALPKLRYCAHCGAEIRRVGLDRHHGEVPAGGDQPRPERPRPTSARPWFRWRWFLRSVGIIFVAYAMLIVTALLAEVLLGITRDSPLRYLLAVLGTTAVVFGGGYAAARRSPGRTVREPAAAAAVLALGLGLAMGEDLGGALGFALPPMLLGLAGAWLGERHQRRKAA